MKKTPMFQRYIIKFIFRISVFLLVFAAYLTDKQQLYAWLKQPVSMGVTPFHALWAILMLIMLAHLFPTERLSMALRKAEEKYYIKQDNYSELELYKYIQNQNEKAWKVMLIWIFGNAVIGLLYLLQIFSEVDLVMISVFYFLSDYICILLYCPFQTHIMKNKCCINCRIYDWGHFMMFTPMVFIRSFFSWSLFFTACVVLIHWELKYIKHPERFWEGSNKKLQCAHCTDKTCQMKKRLTRVHN